MIPEMKGVKLTSEIIDCEACKLAKAKRKPVSETRTRATAHLVRVHSDLMGPLKSASRKSGAKYIVTFTDD